MADRAAPGHSADPDPPADPDAYPGGPDQPAGATGDAAQDFVVFPFPPPWYPSFPKSQYAWYFRSNGVTYVNGTLTVQIVRHLWNKATQEFVSTDRGTLTLTCTRNLIAIPLDPLQMEGTLTIGGSVSTIKATKTSSFYRGCRIEVDAMVNRNFPASAITGIGATGDAQVRLRTAGWDVTVATDEINIPNDASLTNAELALLLSTPPPAGDRRGLAAVAPRRLVPGRALRDHVRRRHRAPRGGGGVRGRNARQQCLGSRRTPGTNR